MARRTRAELEAENLVLLRQLEKMRDQLNQLLEDDDPLDDFELDEDEVDDDRDDGDPHAQDED